MIPLHKLPDSHQVFVEVRSVAKEESGKFYTGRIMYQQPTEYGGSVRVQTEAAQHIHAHWRSVSFRWSDGKSVVNEWIVLRVSETQEEHDRLVALVHKTNPPKP